MVATSAGLGRRLAISSSSSTNLGGKNILDIISSRGQNDISSRSSSNILGGKI